MTAQTQNRIRSERNPDLTRKRILEAAFQAIHRHGYQGTRLDDIIKATGLTKGALYHHFPNKQALGYAVVDEIVAGMIDEMWLAPLRETGDPLGTLVRTISQLEAAAGEQLITLGCPLNNLAQEMSALDEGFRQRLNQLFQRWQEGLRDALDRAVRLGQIPAQTDTSAAATFIVAALEGCIGMAKNAQDMHRLRVCTAGLVDYLRSLQGAH